MAELLASSNQGTFLWSAATSIAIRDTSPHTSDVIDMSAFRERLLIQGVNSLNQTVTITFQGSFDGTNWTNIGSSMALTDGSSTVQTAAAALSDPWPRLRASAVCGSGPASGSLTINFSYREVVA